MKYNDFKNKNESILKSFKDFNIINELNHYQPIILHYNQDKYVYHTTSKSNELKIYEDGFKTGFETGKAEKRKAIYFSDKDVNPGLYARNQEGEDYEGEDIGMVKINIKDLNLLNMTYKKNEVWVNHNKYKDIVVRGELEKITEDVDGTISFLEDGRIYEVALLKDIANMVIVKD